MPSQEKYKQPHHHPNSGNATMALENDAVAGATIELLESRLRRLTYLLTGDANWSGIPTAPAKPASLEESVSRRLLHLERDLERLSRNNPAVRDVLLLRMIPPFLASLLSDQPHPGHTTQPTHPKEPNIQTSFAIYLHHRTNLIPHLQTTASPTSSAQPHPRPSPRTSRPKTSPPSSSPTPLPSPRPHHA